jgi:hypothetical protein
MALDFPNSSIEQTYIAPNGVTYVWNGTSWVVTPILSVSKGGTGFTSYVQGVILYGNSSGTLSKLTAGTSGQALITNGPGSDPYWGTVSSGGAGTVAVGGSGRVSYYPGAGSSVKDAAGVDYSTSTNILTVSAQVNSDNVLQLKGFSGSQSGDALVYKKDGSAVTFKIDKDGIVTSGTWAGNAVTAYYGGTGQQSYTNGQLLIGNSSTSGLTKANLTAGVGISVVNGSGSITVNNNRPVVLTLASGFTPVGIGTDYNVLRVPEGKNLANTNYNIREVILGVGVTSSGTSTIRLEKSVGPHTSTSGFNLSAVGSTTNVMSADLSIIGGIGETSWITFAAGHGTAATGDRIRVNYTAVDSAHANFIIQCLLEEY